MRIHLLRFIIGLSWLFVFGGAIQAQGDSPASPISLGLYGGFNTVRLLPIQRSRATIGFENGAPQLGIDLGLILNWRLSPVLRLRLLPLVSLSELRYRILPGQGGAPVVGEQELTYLHLPLALQACPDSQRRIRPFAQLGFQYSQNLKAKSSNFRSSDFAMLFGLGAKFALGKAEVSPEIRLQQSVLPANPLVPLGPGGRLPTLLPQTFSLLVSFE